MYEELNMWQTTEWQKSGKKFSAKNYVTKNLLEGMAQLFGK